MGAALGIVHFDELELTDVAGERRLGDIEIAAGEQLSELLLAGDAVALDELAYGGVALGLRHARDDAA